jgi:serine/threonine protein kinase
MGDELDPDGPRRRSSIGDYRVDALVGVGGMADVYRVRNLPLARDEALKVLAPSPLVRDADRARVEAEARAASRLNHPNIVTIFAVGAKPRAGTSSPWSSWTGRRCGSGSRPARSPCAGRRRASPCS